MGRACWHRPFNKVGAPCWYLLYPRTKTLNLRMFGMFISFFSVGEWSPLLQTCSGLLFFGTERFLAHLPPARLAPLSLQGSIYHVATEWLIHKSVIRSMSLHFFHQRCGSEMTWRRVECYIWGICTYIPPPFPLPLSADCSIVVLMDQMQTSGSALIQSKLDLHKRYLMIHVYLLWFGLHNNGLMGVSMHKTFPKLERSKIYST